MSALTTTLRILFGLLVLGAGVYGLYICCSLWAWSWWLLFKIPFFIVLLVASLLAVDSGFGLIDKRDKPVELYTIAASDLRQTMIIPGYNGVGAELAEVLRANQHDAYVHGLVTFKPPYEGYDSQKVDDALYDWWRDNHARLKRFCVYAESMGGLEVIRLLLQHPDVYIDELNLSAGLGWRGNVLQPTLLMQTLRHLPGGPILTGMVRIGQQHGVRNSPNLEQGADDRAARAAQRTSLRTTAPMLLGQVASIAAASEPPRPGSLAGRIGRVTYLRAKNPHDDLVDLDGSVKVWREAVGPNTLFEERVVAAFGDSMHTPTPERPFAAVRAVSEAANR